MTEEELAEIERRASARGLLAVEALALISAVRESRKERGEAVNDLYDALNVRKEVRRERDKAREEAEYNRKGWVKALEERDQNGFHWSHAAKERDRLRVALEEIHRRQPECERTIGCHETAAFPLDNWCPACLARRALRGEA